MLAKVKTVLRITHDKLDDEIAETIASARAEMTRAGVLEDVAADDSIPLVSQAIKCYCLAFFANNEKMAEGYKKSFDSILENLRKSKGYGYIPVTEGADENV